MNIYIYGNSKFNKEIYELLEHANAKFRLGDSGKIIELNSLPALKNAIDKAPEDIYLIDDSKIIKKNSLNSKFKFLTPKNGIKEEYLLDHGIGDMSVDSLDELAKHIIHKLDSLNSGESENIEESIRNIVDEAYEEDYEELDDELNSLLVHKEDSNKRDQIDELENEDFEDEEFSSFEEKENIADNDMEDFFNQIPKMEDDILATSSQDYFDEFINEKDEKVEYTQQREEPLADLNMEVNSTFETINQRLLEELRSNDVKESDLMDLEELFNANISSNNVKKKIDTQGFEPKNADEEIHNEKKGDIIKEEKEDIFDNRSNIKKGEMMASNFSELDSLNESDVLSALEGLGDEIVTSTSITKTQTVNNSENKNEAITIEATNLDDISNLLKQLLNNKTLEISIKIKD